MRLPLLAAAGCLLFTVSASAMSADECTALWKQADVNADGTLSGAEVERYAAMTRVAGNEMPPNTPMDQAAFDKNCAAGVFTTAAVDDGAPLKGANSFTEGQAQDRAMAAGFADVSALTKDDNGIWRGTASKDGKPVKIAVDFKGNVVAG